jgi:hypothetical protein
MKSSFTTIEIEGDMSKLSSNDQDRIQNVMIKSQAQARRNAKEWLRRAACYDKKAKLALWGADTQPWRSDARYCLLGKAYEYEDIANNLRNRAALELRGYPLKLERGEGVNAPTKRETLQRAA